MTDEEYKPRYKCKETWTGEGHEDYHAFDDRQSFGRIQLDKTTHTKAGLWKWNIIHIPWVKQRILPQGG
ncbi:hypothetical protein [Rhizobium sp. Nf11,1]|uniref:hypothetical protein n=1 Tax=Rhizobium sp. Nf11,1 TaxID=3404923 RepID=UPI003D353E68